MNWSQPLTVDNDAMRISLVVIRVLAVSGILKFLLEIGRLVLDEQAGTKTDTSRPSDVPRHRGFEDLGVSSAVLLGALVVIPAVIFAILARPDSDWESVEAGECLWMNNELTIDEGRLNLGDFVYLRDCQQPHEGQIYYVNPGFFSDRDVHPGSEALMSEGRARCSRELEEIKRHNGDEGDPLFPITIAPGATVTADDWDRKLICVTASLADDRTSLLSRTGSLSGL